MESTKPLHPLTTATLAARVIGKTIKNSHYRIIGSCLWLKKGMPPKIEPGPAVEQFIPDLVVTVSNNPGENPWVEAGVAFENKAALTGYQAVFRQVMHMPFDYGNGSGQQGGGHLNETRARVVHVIGSPSSLYRLPKLTHQPETTFGKPYYSTHADAVIDRTESAEIVYMLTHPNLLLNHEIGSVTHSWGPEIPRLMRVIQPSRFRASVVSAMHALDIVTNEGMHVKLPTSNQCGPNCVVANVIFEPKQKSIADQQVLWQEVYPNNRMIFPGDPNEFGVEDDAKGHGNYVFVVWRKYRGCVKQQGKLMSGIPNVGRPNKR